MPIDEKMVKWEEPTKQAINPAMVKWDDQPTSVKAGKNINSIPRQAGLAARYLLEGAANPLMLATEPIRYGTDRLFNQVGKTRPLNVLATEAADWMGLPSPQNADERVVADASRLVAGTGLTMGAGQAANAMQKAPALFSEASSRLPAFLADRIAAAKAADIGKFITQQPVTQLASAAGSGLAGGASREAGGSQGGQVLASVAGGLGGAGAVGLGNSLATKATGIKNKFITAMTPQQMDVKIGETLRQTGVDYSQVPERIRQSLRQELADSLRTNQDLNPQAVARLLDFRTAGLTPTRGMLTLDPVQVTREQNLAKIGANSADGQLQGLARIQNENNARLIGNLNALGASRGDTLQAGETVAGSILRNQAGLRGAETAAWNEARGSVGYRAPISSSVISDINQALGDEALMPFMNPTISRYMEAFQTGQPFTPQDYRNLRSMLSAEMAKGGNEARAAGLAGRILDNANLTPQGFVGGGNAVATPGMAAAMRGADNAATEAIDAVNRARGATRAAYAYEDSSPLVRSVLSGGASSDPQRIAERFVIGGTANEAADLVNEIGPRGLQVVKDAVVANLKNKALSGAADEVGKFSQSAFNRSLNALGDRKLSILFTPEELTALRTNARAASYMQFQPAGSAVNNSNSGALLLGRGIDVLDKIPFVGPMTSPVLKNIEVSLGNRQAQNIAPSLLLQQPRTSFSAGLIGPSLGMGGLLAAPRE